MKNINCKTNYRSDMYRISCKIMQGLHKSADMKNKGNSNFSKTLKSKTFDNLLII